MSRVAKAVIKLPNNVELKVINQCVMVKGPKGSIENNYNKAVNIKIDSDNNNAVFFKPVNNESKAWAHAGTTRALVNNMIIGVTKGFEQTLELIGVGFRAQALTDKLNLSLGFSHVVEYLLPKGIKAETPSNTTIVISGIDKQLIGQVAAEIRSLRPPEPYKGKGVKYLGEVILRKEAKKK